MLQVKAFTMLMYLLTLESKFTYKFPVSGRSAALIPISVIEFAIEFETEYAP